MDKRIIKRKLLTIVLVLVLIWLILSIIRDNLVTDNNKTGEITPTLKPVPTETVDNVKTTGESDTGAAEWIVSDQEKKIDSQVLDLEQKVPIENDQFKLVFDYSVDVFSFVVTFKGTGDEGLKSFQGWLKENGYGDIPMEQFIIR